MLRSLWRQRWFAFYWALSACGFGLAFSAAEVRAGHTWEDAGVFGGCILAMGLFFGGVVVWANSIVERVSRED